MHVAIMLPKVGRRGLRCDRLHREDGREGVANEGEEKEYCR